ncbi:MAG: metallopeptidase family protein [Phycisphaerales bacterium JB039]
MDELRPITDADRDRFDALVERAIDALPAHVRARLDVVTVVVLDAPGDDLLADIGVDMADAAEVAAARAELCGLHSGRALTELSVDDPPEVPSQVHLFRRGILELAGWWEAEEAEGAVTEEIQITLLHELGHEYGLDEDDLEELGYE